MVVCEQPEIIIAFSVAKKETDNSGIPINCGSPQTVDI